MDWRRPCIGAFAVVLLACSCALLAAGTDGERAEIDTRPRAAIPSVESTSADKYLSSLGINIHIDQGYAAASYVQPLQYLGIRAVRTGFGNVFDTVALAQKTGVRAAIFANGGILRHFINSAKALAAADALLALEGPNEPNNFPLTYKGQQGGGSGTWLPVAYFQRDVYAAVKADPALAKYPVFSPSEAGAENDNVGLQFLTIPEGVDTLLPAGTRFADYVALHNYVIGNGHKHTHNQAWNAADPTLNERWDGLYGNNGVTWRNSFLGYDKKDLLDLPRVTTETGWLSDEQPNGREIQARLLINTYLAQFKRGFRYTFLYQLRDGEGGEDSYGIFDRNSKPKPAATQIHNLTAILADHTPNPEPRKLSYAIAAQPPTVHDLLLHKGDGSFALVLWGERVSGSDDVRIEFATSHSVKIYDVALGLTPVKELKGVREVDLKIADHALILEVTE